MPGETFPIEIEGETLELRFEDRDVKEIEKSLSLFVAFHPINRTYENAALILWRGLRKNDGEGNLVYAIQQGPPGNILAFQKVKSFCRQFGGPAAAMVALYASYQKALIASGWYSETSEDTPKNPAEPEAAPPKN